MHANQGPMARMMLQAPVMASVLFDNILQEMGLKISNGAPSEEILIAIWGAANLTGGAGMDIWLETVSEPTLVGQMKIEVILSPAYAMRISSTSFAGLMAESDISSDWISMLNGEVVQVQIAERHFAAPGTAVQFNPGDEPTVYRPQQVQRRQAFRIRSMATLHIVAVTMAIVFQAWAALTLYVAVMSMAVVRSNLVRLLILAIAGVIIYLLL